MSRTAVVLFNLGGPDRPESVEPFLRNLFSDPAIIRVPTLARWLLARLIARRRAPIARENYDRLGGGSPLLPNTRAQAAALQGVLGDDHRVFVCMRYWHPMADEVAREVAAWGPERVVLLPLYPQFSTTTTGSSLADWARAAARAGLERTFCGVCCYPTSPGLVRAMAAAIAPLLEAKSRLLFSAHGLPKRVIADGDPYQDQIEETARAVVAALDRPGLDQRGLDWQICYQSRVGPLEWIGPSTEAELRRAAQDGVPVVVAPIAFVSDHVETLVEIEIEYRHLAAGLGVPGFTRVPALGTAPDFIAALAELVRGAVARGAVVATAEGVRRCTARCAGCPMPAR